MVGLLYSRIVLVERGDYAGVEGAALAFSETGVGGFVFGTAAGLELVEAAGATAVAFVAGKGAEHSAKLMGKMLINLVGFQNRHGHLILSSIA
ncbi:hypothetical protein H1S01_17260 [Heliobacterium chlorum]|uniref:Uncharacterized protein n=1 Tax=Heliobacterium chlorum TaxID=2698 RepID=A0ABR7T611_HELCL|nr:hypothetical protein [Heliobacterium chlorum]MBC9786214.1 hypothetical protein [Heliobacterium chlorum]